MSETSVPSPAPGAPASSEIGDIGYVPDASVGGRLTSPNAGAAMTANATAASAPASRTPFRARVAHAAQLGAVIQLTFRQRDQLPARSLALIQRGRFASFTFSFFL